MIAGFLVAFIALGIIYVSSGKATRYLIDSPRQTVSERVFEAMSPSRWMGEYYGLGRLFFIINTPRALVIYAPMGGLIGMGPGTFGGGVAQALHYTKSYGVLGLPFGIWGSEGHVDNNWFSLLGEIGFLGVLAYVSILGLLFFTSFRLYLQPSKSEEPNTLLKDGVEFPSRNSHLMSQAATPPQAETMLAALRHTSQRELDSSVAVNPEEKFTRAVGLGYCGVLAAFFCLGFFAMYFEMRTLAPYVWILGGLVVTLNYKTQPSSISLLDS